MQKKELRRRGEGGPDRDDDGIVGKVQNLQVQQFKGIGKERIEVTAAQMTGMMG